MPSNRSTPPDIATLLAAPPRIRSTLLESAVREHPELAIPLLQAFSEHDAHRQRSLDQCQAALDELQNVLEETTRPPLLVSAVTAVDGDMCTIALGTARQCVKVSSEFAGPPPVVGEVVTVAHEGNVVLARLDGFRPANRVGIVHRWHEGKLLVEHGPNQYLPLEPAPALLAADVQPGDQVLYHDQWQIAFDRAERASQVVVDSFDRVAWTQIAGLDDQIDELTLAIELKFRYPDIVEALRMPQIGGIVLTGPPGTGKTLLMQGLATWIEQEFGQRVVFRVVPPGSWRDSYYGVSEQRIVEPVHEAGRLLAAGQADLVILFYDEFDTLGSRSGEVTNHIDSRVMTALLAAMDGVRKRHNLLVCAATNREDLIDEALLRPGRFGDLILQVPRPGREAARAIFRCHLRPDVQFWTNGQAHPAAEMVERSIDAALGRLFCDADPADALAELVLAGGQRRPVWPREVVSGAMIANIVSRAKRLAARRGLVGPRGLVPVDLAHAADDELDTVASRLTDVWKAREILGDRHLPIARVEVRRRRAALAGR